MDNLFSGRHFDREVITLCVRWYLRFRLSFRDLVEMMAERGLNVAHTTILRWVQRYVPEFIKRWKRLVRPVGGRGASTRHMSRYAGTGFTSTGRWIKPGRRSTSDSAGRAT